MVDTDADPSGIGGQIIDAIGHRPTEFLDQEVVHPDLFRVALRAILAAIVPEVADQFLLLGVDRDHRLLFGQSSGHLGVDMGELRVPVGMAVALLGLAVALQAVTRRIEQFGHQGTADLVALRCSASASRRTLLQVQRNGDSGSPRVVGSTSASRSAQQRRVLRTAGLRPAPGRRTRPDGSSCANSLRPRPIVLGAMPVAIATAAMPP